MKFFRTFGLITALAAFAAFLPGTATATELRNSSEMLASGSTVAAEAEETVVLKGFIGNLEHRRLD
jgi:hypothetical protein